MARRRRLWPHQPGGVRARSQPSLPTKGHHGMKFTIFQSDKGDCLLLESDDKKRILVDGGMPDAFPQHAGPKLGNLREQNVALDLVYISHIDQDHIGGVLKLMDDEAAWRVFEHQQNHGNPSAKQPTAPRPAKVKEIWHNAFHEQ